MADDYTDGSDLLNSLFDERVAITAGDLASAFDLEQSEVSAAARDVGAQMFGSAYLITRDVAEAVLDQFDFDSDDECDAEDEDEDDDEQDEG